MCFNLNFFSVHLSGCSCRTSPQVPEHSPTRRPRSSLTLGTVMLMARSESMVRVPCGASDIFLQRHHDIYTPDACSLILNINSHTLHICTHTNLWSGTRSNQTPSHHLHDILQQSEYIWFSSNGNFLLLSQSLPPLLRDNNFPMEPLFTELRTPCKIQ